jgi:hypothetical protein
MLYNAASRRIYAVRFIERCYDRHHDRRVPNAAHNRGLHKRSVHCLHGLAAILAVMTMRRTRHGVTALHRLLRRRCAAVERIRRESDRE